MEVEFNHPNQKIIRGEEVIDFLPLYLFFWEME